MSKNLQLLRDIVNSNFIKLSLLVLRTIFYDLQVISRHKYFSTFSFIGKYVRSASKIPWIYRKDVFFFFFLNSFVTDTITNLKSILREEFKFIKIMHISREARKCSHQTIFQPGIKYPCNPLINFYKNYSMLKRLLFFAARVERKFTFLVESTVAMIKC